MVTEILSIADTLPRNIGHNPSPPEENNYIVRLVTLAGTTYANEFSQFAYRMNTILVNTGIHIQVVNCTFLSLSRLLFNNNDQVSIVDGCQPHKCTVCKNDIRNKTGVVKSEVTGNTYKVDDSLNCSNGGIYVIDTSCPAQYSGKTVHFGVRSYEHFSLKSTAITSHRNQCNLCINVTDFKITYVENYLKRGKYSLSEREFLWNHRVKGSINAQKTLKS